MGAELGQTLNPKDLIPGEPERISQDLRSLVGDMRSIDGAGADLAKVDPAQWTGQASEQFRSVFGAQPPKWTAAVQKLGGSGQSLADFGHTLTWGQGEAQRAIEMYVKAQAASRVASAQYHEQAQTAAANGTAPEQLPPFKDPGSGLAGAAQQVLDNARKQVATVGDGVAVLLGFSDKDGKTEYKTDVKDLKKGWGAEKDEKDGPSKYGKKYDAKAGYGSKKGQDFLSDKVGISGPEKEIWAKEAGVSVASGEVEGEAGNETVGASGKAEGSVLGADAGAKVTAGPTGVTASAEAEAYLAKGSAEGEAHLGPGKVQGSAEAIVGAKGEAHGHIGLTGVDAGAEAFAGAKATADASASVAGVGAGAHGEAWAGVGAEANAQLGMGTDGKFHLGASAGVALGVGGKIGFDVTIDPQEVTDTAKHVADDVGEAAKDVGGAVSSGVKSIGHAFGL